MGESLPIVHAGAVRSATERAEALARGQFGAIARRQLLAMGNSRSRIANWVSTGRLHARYPGVYAWGRAELPEAGELAAALLRAGSGSALTGTTALWWHRLLARRPYPLHLSAPGRARSLGGLRFSHPRRMERTEHRGLPVVPLPDALLVAAGELSHDALRVVLARAEFQGVLSLTEIESSLGRGQAGSSALHAAMDAHLPQLARCTNRFERSFVLLCERHGLPIPDPNERIGRYRPDMLWPQQRLIVELDGHDAHSTAAQLAADARRQAELEARGFTVVRFTWRDVTQRPAEVAATVAMHLS